MSGITGIQAYSSLSQNGNVTFGEIPKTDTLFPKAKIPKNGKTGISFFGKQESPFYRHSQNQIPKNKLPKMVLGKFSMFRGNPDYPQKAISHILAPFFPKITQKQNTRENSPSDSNRIDT